MLKMKLALCLFAVCSTVYADNVELYWEPVTHRVDGTLIEGAVDYVISHNGTAQPPTTQTNHNLEADPGDSLCVYAREDEYPGPDACTTIAAYPTRPTITIKITFEVDP